MNTTFVERLWFLIKDKAGGKSTVFAKKAGISSGTFDAYLNGRVPKAEQLLRIYETYGVDITWLLTGKGQPYMQRQDAPASEPGREENSRAGGQKIALQADFRISEALTMTAEVLDSGTSYATALFLNIQHFHRAITAEKRIEQLELEVSSLQERILRLEKHMTMPAKEAHVNTQENPETGPIQQKTA